VPGLVLGGVITFAVSLMLACALLRWRCRRIGPPFGRARGTGPFHRGGHGQRVRHYRRAVPGRRPGAPYVGILVPGGLWLSKLPPQRDRDMLPRAWPALLTMPFSRLYDRMGDDMQEWCDTRTEAARPKPQWIADAAQYYWNQMGRVTDRRARADLDRWLQSITHKIAMVNLIDLEPGPPPATGFPATAPLDTTRPPGTARTTRPARPGGWRPRPSRTAPVPRLRLPARLLHDADLPLPLQRPPRRRPACPAYDPGPVDPGDHASDREAAPLISPGSGR